MQVRRFVNAVSLFLSKLSSEKVCDPTDTADKWSGCFCCRVAPPQATAGQLIDILCHPQSWTDIHSHLLNSNYLLLFSHRGLFPRRLDKLKDQFCPCCKGVHDLRTTSRTMMEYKSNPLTAPLHCLNIYLLSMPDERTYKKKKKKEYPLNAPFYCIFSKSLNLKRNQIKYILPYSPLCIVCFLPCKKRWLSWSAINTYGL